jgi:hypothetical protein
MSTHPVCRRSSAATPGPVPEAASARVRLARLVCVACLLLPAAGTAAAQQVSEAAVKAAFVLNFMKFVEWPAGAFASPQAPMVLCVTGAGGDLVEALLGLEGRLIQGRSLTIRRMARTDEQSGCNASYLAGGTLQAAQQSIATAAPTLTMGDSPGFASAGGMIGLYSEDGKMRFEINPGTLQRASLRVSSQLMKLARIADDAHKGDIR